MGIFDYDATPANNTAIDGYSIAEGGPAGDLNDAIRAMAADLAQYLADSGGALDTTGSSNAYAVTTSQTWASYADGQAIIVRANHSNTGAATINVDSLGAKTIKKFTGDGVADVASGDIQSGGVYSMTYDNGNGYFILVGGLGTGDFSALSVSGDVTVSAATTETRSLLVGDGRSGDGISRIRLVGDTTYSTWGFQFSRDGGANGTSKLQHRGTGNIEMFAIDAGGILFGTSNAEKARMDTSGNFLFGKTSSALGTAGVEIYNQGRVDITNASNALLFINRLTDDGNLVQFYQDGTLEGNISVSGTVVTYGNFLGSHYSECENPTEFLPGTIVESTGELVSDRFTSSERLVKFKVATKGSKAVYGTILGPSLEDDIEDEGGNKIPQGEGRNPVRTQYLVAGLGAYQVRMKKGQKPVNGDLVESAGGGVGAVQKDDILRSKTVAKITGSHSVATYEDGSTVWPAVIMCG